MVIQKLKDEGIFDNTLVMVPADNGEFHGAHSLADKWYPYSESIHVPLIIRDPRMPKEKRGTLDHSFPLNMDLASTILGAAGLESPPYMDDETLLIYTLKIGLREGRSFTMNSRQSNPAFLLLALWSGKTSNISTGSNTVIKNYLT